MKVDFDTIAILFGFILNSAGMAALWSTIEKDELRQTEAVLKNSIKTKLSDSTYVSKNLDNLKSQLLSLWIILLHILNIIILLGLFLVLIIGPEKIFSRGTPGTLAEPLMLWERIIYWIWFALLILAYIIRGLSPYKRLWSLCSEAHNWLEENAPKNKS